jgi:signal transduction histidine kinase
MKRFLTWPLALSRSLRHSPDNEPPVLATRTRHDRAFLHVSRCALRTADAPTLLADVCRITARALLVDHVHVAELLIDGQTLVARAACGWSPERLAHWRFALDPHSRLAEAVRQSTLVVLGSGAEGGDAMGRELLVDLQMQAGVVAGVAPALNCSGLLGAYSAKPRKFNAEELQFLRGVAHIVESTLERCGRVEAQRTARSALNAAQADLLRIVVGRLAPSLRDSIGQLSKFRTTSVDTFAFRRTVRQTERQVAAVAEFIEDVKLLADLLDGWRPSPHPVGVVPLIGSVVDQLSDRIEKNELTVHVRALDQSATALGDAGLIRRAIYSIVDNALRFTDAGGSVVVAVATSNPGWISIEVSDTGRGMTSSQIVRLTEQREGAIRSMHRGPGIGWRLASAIVDAHGGSITPLSGGPDQGATVRITLPSCHLADLN